MQAMHPCPGWFGDGLLQQQLQRIGDRTVKAHEQPPAIQQG